jgi:hypothetical protein
MLLIAPFSVEQLRAILNGDPTAVYKTVRAVTVSKGVKVSHMVHVTNGELISIFERVANNTDLVAEILEEQRLDTIEILDGATSTSRPIRFVQEIMVTSAKSVAPYWPL